MKKALFVGVNDYKDPQIRNLSFSLADAFSLNAVFENLGYDTKVLANPTRLDLITAIRECNQSLKQGDSFFFYFAGHGWTTTGGVHLLFCSDDVYDPNGNFNAGVSFGGLKAETTGNGYNRAFVLDACRSHFLEGARDVVDNTTRDLRPIGELLEEDNQQNNAGSLAVIRSCSQNEHAIEIAAAQHGLFTLAMQSVMSRAIQEGRQLSFGTEFCSEITAEMRAFANKHKILNTQTPEFAMAGEQQVLIPGQPRNNRENAPIYYSCPICGKNNLVTETFNCKKCSTEYLCLSHKSQELGICEKCYSTTVSQPPPAPRDINKVKCADIPDQIFKKGSACPECHLFDEEFDCALVKGKDYVVQYEDVDSLGFATIVITGIGKYYSERRVTFEIKKEDIPILPTPDAQEEPPASLPESSQVVPVIDRPWFKWLALSSGIALLVGVGMVVDSSCSYSAVDSSASRPSASVQENKLDDVFRAPTYRPTQCSAPAYDDNKRYEDGSCCTFTLPGGVEMEMVYVAPGEFNMGSDSGDKDEKPVHPVRITKGYWIGKYPVTQAQWGALVEKNVVVFSSAKGEPEAEPKARFSSQGGRRHMVKGINTSDFPMESVSWNDCDTLVKVLNSKESTSTRWMIPTEAQWEFAARGGNKSKWYTYSGGNDLDVVGWYYSNSVNRTHSVQEKNVGNELGIVGMSGNVWEWCRDTYDSGYYQQCKVKGMVEDPCNVAASGGNRVLRGGSWFNDTSNCRSALRGRNEPGGRSDSCGFRLSCSAGPHENLTEQESRVDDSRLDGAGGSTASGTAMSTVEKINAELEKKAQKAFVAKDWKTGFDIATYLTMNSISDSYVTYFVGYCYSPTYQTPYPIKKDFEKAYKWFNRTAELEDKRGDGIVQCILGDMELKGNGCTVNTNNAIKWYRISAERNYARGCYELGKCYEDNIVADTNDIFAAATNWYYKAMSLNLKGVPAKDAYERVLKKIKERETAKGACLSVKIAEQEDWTYFKFSIKPISEMNVIPKDVVVLLDCSGSMGKLRLNNCFANIEKNLRSCMNPGDRFNLAAYHGDDKCSYVFNSWQQCTEESYEKASKWMNSLSPNGRGNVLGAVESVFKLSRDSKRPLIVLVITDKISDNQADETLSRKLSSFTKHNDGSVSVYLYCCSKRFHNRTLVDVFTCVNGGECLFSNSRLASTSADDLHSLFIRFRNPILAGLHPVFTDDTKTELISTNMKNFYLNEVVDIIGRVPRGTKDISFSIKGCDGKDMHELFFKCNLSNGESDKSILDFWKDTQTFLCVGCLQKANQNVVAVEVDHNKVNPVKRVQLWEGGPYWADRNIGAEKPEDYGYYFWWGDTVGYKWVNDKWIASDGSNSNFSFDYETTPTFGESISDLQNQGWIIDKNGVNVLTPKYDAARAHWGGDWRMPTTQEFDDLKERCKWTWTTRNGVNGYVVQGKGNYSSAEIFLPCAGLGYVTPLGRTGLYGTRGNYWSSVPNTGGNDAWCLSFASSYHTTNDYNRAYGQSVRPLQGFTK